MSTTQMTRPTLPRELADGLFWLGDCIRNPFEGRILHGYHSSYLVTGTDCSLLVEAGHPKDLPVIQFPGEIHDAIRVYQLLLGEALVGLLFPVLYGSTRPFWLDLSGRHLTPLPHSR